MKSHTIHRTFDTDGRREFIRITDDVQDAVDEAGIAEGRPEAPLSAGRAVERALNVSGEG